MILYASLDASDQSEGEFVLPVPIQLKSKLLQSQCSLSALQQQLEELNYKCAQYERYIQRQEDGLMDVKKSIQAQ